RLLVRVALDHALPDDTGRVVCSEVVYRAYAECTAEPAGRLAPVIVVGERGTAPFPDIDWKRLLEQLWPLLGPRDRQALEPARTALLAGTEDGAGLPGLPVVGDDELEAARRAALGRAGLLAGEGGRAARLDDPGTVVPDPNPRLVSPRDPAASPGLVRGGRVRRRDAPRAWGARRGRRQAAAGGEGGGEQGQSRRGDRAASGSRWMESGAAPAVRT